MKRTILIVALLGLGTTLGLAQTGTGSGTDNNANVASRRDNGPESGHNWGWIGLLGLAGLAGLGRRKSETVRSLEGRGVNVKAV